MSSQTEQQLSDKYLHRDDASVRQRKEILRKLVQFHVDQEEKLRDYYETEAYYKDQDISSLKKQLEAKDLDQQQIIGDAIADVEQKHSETVYRMEQEQKDVISKLLWQHEGKLKNKRAEIYDLKASVDESRNRYQEELTAALQEKDDYWSQQVGILRSDLTQKTLEMDRLNMEYEKGLNTLGARFKAELEVHNQHHELEINESKKAHIRLEDSHKEQVAELAREHEAQRQALETKLNDERQSMQKEFAAKTVAMKANLTKLSAALMARDDDTYKSQKFVFNAKSLEDPVLKSMFGDLAKLVEDAGRFEWMVDQKMWSTQALNKLCTIHNLAIGTVKRYILQDCIWTILYRHIFCSPFRIFGVEGDVLERQWIKQAEQGNDYDDGDGRWQALFSWPEPQFDTERWRYFTIRECRTILRQKMSGQDPRAKIKKDFKEQSDKLKAEMESSLSEIVSLDRTSRERLDNMRMLAVNVWLEFGMQRCRLRVRMHGTEPMSTMEKSSLAAGKSLRLVVCPSLGRHGNASGFELTEYSTLKGCDGELL